MGNYGACNQAEARRIRPDRKPLELLAVEGAIALLKCLASQLVRELSWTVLVVLSSLHYTTMCHGLGDG
ncbi:MAG: hypothetical protein AAFY20_13365 [Cyanobacteria bacterium J06639_14]